MMTDYELSLKAMEDAAQQAVAYRRAILHAASSPTVAYDKIVASLSGPTPEAPDDARAVIRDLVSHATPGLRATTSPRFFGWVIGCSHPVGVAADWLTSAWGQNAGNIEAAPAAAAAEAAAARWLLDILRLPAEASIGFVTGATMASFTCLAAARGEVLRRVGWDVEADGLIGAPPIQVLIGADAHATIFSALRYLGLGAKRVTTIETNALGQMDPAAFERALRSAPGPVIAITQAGQINTGASDDFAAIVPAAHDAGAWVHVDGAFGLWAQASARHRAKIAGVELADSWSTDGHKWLQTPYDCGLAIVRDEAAHRSAMSISASYLPAAAGDARDPSAYVPELSRRARGFSTWAMLRHLGRSGIAEMVDRACDVATHMAGELAKIDGVEIVTPVALNQFMVRFAGSDALTMATVREVQADATAYIGGASWRGDWVMRVSVSSSLTTIADADLTVEAIRRAFSRARGEGQA